MIRFLSLAEIQVLHREVIAHTGGSDGIRDLSALESALAQPPATFGSEDLYPDVLDKAACLGFTLVSNHPFVDGNKRIGHAALMAFLHLNGYGWEAEIDDEERQFLTLAAGELDREQFTAWVKAHAAPRQP